MGLSFSRASATASPSEFRHGIFCQASSSSLGTMKECHFLKLSSFSSCAAIGRPRNIPKATIRMVLIEAPPGRAGRRHLHEVMPPSPHIRAEILSQSLRAREDEFQHKDTKFTKVPPGFRILCILGTCHMYRRLRNLLPTANEQSLY